MAAGLDNLLMAGRCISAGHLAESSLRIQQTCTAASLSLAQGHTPRELDPGLVVRHLETTRAAVHPAWP